MRSDMEIRHKLLLAVTALLYFGPLLAGMGGFGWSVVPVFLIIFVLWLVVMRPQDWPQSRADWRSGDNWVAMAARIAVQVLLVVVLFGVGRGMGGMLGVLPAIPALLKPLLDRGFTQGALPIWIVPVVASTRLSMTAIVPSTLFETPCCVACTTAVPAAIAVRISGRWRWATAKLT